MTCCVAVDKKGGGGALTFSTRPSTYRISLAPTGRARCRRCKRAIAKGALRLEICVFVRPNRYTTLLRCAGCVDAALSRAILAVHKAASRVPADAMVDESAAARVCSAITSLGGGAR